MYRLFLINRTQPVAYFTAFSSLISLFYITFAHIKPYFDTTYGNIIGSEYNERTDYTSK